MKLHHLFVYTFQLIADYSFKYDVIELDIQVQFYQSLL